MAFGVKVGVRVGVSVNVGVADGVGLRKAVAVGLMRVAVAVCGKGRSNSWAAVGRWLPQPLKLMTINPIHSVMLRSKRLGDIA